MSSIQGLLALTNVALKAMDLYEAGMIGYEEYRGTRDKVESKLKQLRSENRDITWDEIDDAQNALTDALARGRKK